MHRNSEQTKSEDIHTFSSLFSLMWKTSPILLVSVALSSILSGLFGIAAIDVINIALSEKQQNSAELLSKFAIVALLHIIFQLLTSLLPACMGRRITQSLRSGLAKSVLAAPLSLVEKLGIPDVHAILTNDIPVVARSLFVLPLLLANAAVVFFGFVYIGYKSFAALVIFIFALGIGIAGYALFYRHAAKFTNLARGEYSNFSKHLFALLFGLKELKLHCQRRRWFFNADLHLSTRRLGAYGFKEHMWFEFGSGFGQVCYYFLLGSLIGWKLHNPLANDVAFTACVLAIVYLIGHVTVLVDLAPTVTEGVVSLNRLHTLQFSLNVQQSPTAPSFGMSKHLSNSIVWKQISLNNVEVCYEETHKPDQFLLGPVTLTLSPGQLIFIVGGNGSGKSTLIKTLCGLYSPSKGEITVDSENLNEFGIERYRNLFSTVFADFFILRRILDRDADITRKMHLRQYLSMFGLEDKVLEEQGCLSEPMDLSSGQRRRLALVVACLDDRPILILDEWAADQDPVSREFFYSQFLPGLTAAGKCVVVVSHDDRYFHIADRILKLEGGKVVSERARQ